MNIDAINNGASIESLAIKASTGQLPADRLISEWKNIYAYFLSRINMTDEEFHNFRASEVMTYDELGHIANETIRKFISEEWTDIPNGSMRYMRLLNWYVQTLRYVNSKRYEESVTLGKKLFRIFNLSGVLRHLIHSQWYLIYHDQILLLKKRSISNCNIYSFSQKLMSSSKMFSIGRSLENNLVINRKLISRNHAMIKFSHGRFILIDNSTNGTYLFSDNGEKSFIRHQEMTLNSQGSICLGEAMLEGNPDILRYECRYVTLPALLRWQRRINGL